MPWQSKYWFFTLNHPRSRDEAEFPELVRISQWLVYQLERGDNGTEHYQGYCVFPTNKRLAGVRKLLSRAHWEPRKGTHEEAKNYCSKEDTRVDGPWEYGEEPVPRQGERNDLIHLKAAIDRGATTGELYEEFFGSYIRYGRGIDKYRAFVASTIKRRPPKVFVLWGETGVGKSEAADWFLEFQESDYYVLERSDTGTWWDGYYGQRCVLVDEFYGWVCWSSLLRMIDRYRARAWQKGGSFPLIADTFVFTSNQSPSFWYKYGGHMQYKTLWRRLRYIVNCTDRECWLLEKTPWSE